MEHAIMLFMTDEDHAAGSLGEDVMRLFKEGNTWHAVGGYADQYRGQSLSISMAIRHMARSANVKGTAQLSFDWTDKTRIINL